MSQRSGDRSGDVAHGARAKDTSARVVYVGENQETRTMIIDTVDRLPHEIAEFACKSCVFVSVGKVRGITLPSSWQTWPGAESPEHLIVLLDHKPSSEFAAIIAHEIAHAWLGHNYFKEQGFEIENEAAALARSWGFSGGATVLHPPP